jgi:hypothetical protein
VIVYRTQKTAKILCEGFKYDNDGYYFQKPSIYTIDLIMEQEFCGNNKVYVSNNDVNKMEKGKVYNVAVTQMYYFTYLVTDYQLVKKTDTK